MNRYEEMIRRLREWDEDENIPIKPSRNDLINLLEIIVHGIKDDISKNLHESDIEINIQSKAEYHLIFLSDRLRRLNAGFTDKIFDYLKSGSGRSQKLDEKEFDALVKEALPVIMRMRQIPTKKAAAKALAEVFVSMGKKKQGSVQDAAQILRIYNRKRNRD